MNIEQFRQKCCINILVHNIIERGRSLLSSVYVVKKIVAIT